jgi:Transmembrane amino acid transporter protein
MNHGTSPTVSEGFRAARLKTHINGAAIFNCLPLIIFSFMYQVNIPAIYTELADKSLQNMKKVLTLGTLGASFLYIIAGIFGLVAFAAVSPSGYPLDTSVSPPVQWSFERIFMKQNILTAPYRTPGGKTPMAIYICLFGILIVVAFSAPLSVLPMKDSIE